MRKCVRTRVGWCILASSPLPASPGSVHLLSVYVHAYIHLHICCMYIHTHTCIRTCIRTIPSSPLPASPGSAYVLYAYKHAHKHASADFVVCICWSIHITNSHLHICCVHIRAKTLICRFVVCMYMHKHASAYLLCVYTHARHCLQARVLPICYMYKRAQTHTCILVMCMHIHIVPY